MGYSRIYASLHGVWSAHVLLSIIDDFLIDLMPPNVWREAPPDDHDSIVTSI